MSQSETVKKAEVPVYERKEVPEELKHLRTMTELKAQRLKPADGQKPVAMLRVYRRGHGWGEFPLYDPAGAAKMRPLSAKQKRTMEDRRTCPKCREVRDQVVYLVCEPCREQEQREAQALQARTCWTCRRVSAAALPDEQERRCVPCWLHLRLRQQFEAERMTVWLRTCPGRDCEVVTATDEEIAAERVAGTWSLPRWCPPCAERDARERVERQQQAEQDRRDAAEARVRQVTGLEQWAREVLADPDTIVLDTETTGFPEDGARIVEITVLGVDGSVLLDTLVNPGEPIPAPVSDIHGITDGMVRDAPDFGSVLPDLTRVLTGKRCLIYNKPFDVGMLRNELLLHNVDREARDRARQVLATGTVAEWMSDEGREAASKKAAAWLDGLRFEDAMVPYSDWYGEWSYYWNNYRWQPLDGGHRAAGDCRAVLQLLREMAENEDQSAV